MIFKTIFKRRIYLDYASLTPIDRRVWREIKKYSKPQYANPSSWYKEGLEAKNALIIGRKTVCDFIHAHPDEIVFTSGGTEANNLAIFGLIESFIKNGREYHDIHIISSTIEHSSVRECLTEIKNRGGKVDVIGVNSSGVVDLDELKNKIKPQTVLVSIMTVNNETGVVQPIKEIARIVRQARKHNSSQYPYFHTDASQAAIHQNLNVEQLGVDLLTLDGGKVYGPRGIGALYVKRQTPLKNIIFGGGQENGLRSGTENLPAIMGLAKALNIISATSTSENARILTLRNRFIADLKKIRPDIVIHGQEAVVSPHIINVSIPGIDNEFLIFQLDAKGLACSTKSSCLRDDDESYVLKAMGVESKDSIRVSFGRLTSKGDVAKLINALRQLVSK